MNPLPTPDRFAPPPAPSVPRPVLRPPAPSALFTVAPGAVMGNRAFLRAWAARRARAATEAAPRPPAPTAG
ncbi:MAG: hypothetical protein HZC55_00280 [Verrucomicrobia bacterium]|nr:hypothetical protein [Verrucomicrobiota bacterium]